MTGIPIDMVGGTSIGALVGAMIAEEIVRLKLDMVSSEVD
jgi:predicted acylesterase/phospholipase RssA